MPGIAKAWNEFATKSKLKDLDKKTEANKAKSGAKSEVSVKAGAKVINKQVNERKQLMDEIFNGQ